MSDAVRSTLAASGCLLRGLPLFFRAAPRTPLRVLGIIALDTLHVLRRSRPLPRPRVQELAAFLDLEGCANQQWDHKRPCAAECQALMQRLEKAGLGPCTTDYLNRLRDLEGARPAPGGDQRRCDEVRAYREAVARLSITTAAAIALNEPCLDDDDVEALFCILMQCQIIDDVMDYREDQAAGLPSFLTASASLPLAMELTTAAARYYAANQANPKDCLNGGGRAIFPLRVMLGVVTALTTLTIRMTRPILNTRQRGAEQTC